MRTAVLAVRLGELAGASAEDLSATYYVALLHASGCTSNGHEAAQLYGDDITHRAAFFLIDATNPAEVLAFYQAYIGAGRPPEVREALIEDAIANAGPRARDAFATMCEVAQRFAGWLDLGTDIQAALEYRLRALGRTWVPEHRRRRDPVSDAPASRGEGHLPLPLRRPGPTTRGQSLERRAGAAYEPRLAELAVTALRRAPRRSRRDPDLGTGARDRAVPEVRLEGRADRLRRSWRSPRSPASSRRGCASTRRAWPTSPRRRPGGSASRRRTVTLVRRTALAHDIGRVGVSNAIWEKPGPLGFGEWERVRLHPHFSERAFAQSRALAPIGRLAGSHHERLDGSGYHRGTGGTALDLPARILAAADCYGAMREARPHRAALDASAAEVELQGEVAAGRLDPDAVDAVLGAAGHRVRDRPRDPPGRSDGTRAGGSPRSRARWIQSADRRRISASPPRPSATTSSTSTRRSAFAVARLRPSGRSRTTSFTRHRAFARCVVESRRAHARADTRRRRTTMILATTKVDEFDRFLEIFSTKGAEKRQAARLEGRARVSRPQRGRSRLGAVRLGRGRLAELRLRPRGPADHAGGRSQGPAADRGCPAATTTRSPSSEVWMRRRRPRKGPPVFSRWS